MNHSSFQLTEASAPAANMFYISSPFMTGSEKRWTGGSFASPIYLPATVKKLPNAVQVVHACTGPAELALFQFPAPHFNNLFFQVQSCLVTILTYTKKLSCFCYIILQIVPLLQRLRHLLQ